jgi:beta-lactamase class A
MNGLPCGLPSASELPRQAVAYRDLVSGRSFGQNETASFHAASTMKLAVMMAVYRWLDLDDGLRVENRFRSVVNGSHYAVGLEDDSDSLVHEKIGDLMPIRQLVERMIVRSSNLATNLLVDRLGTERVNSHGVAGVVVRRGVEDMLGFGQGINNEATAEGLAKLLVAIARDSSQAGEEMLRTLLAQEFNRGIPAGLPPGTPVANKPGWTSKVVHDAAIVDPYGERPYVLVVMTEGHPSSDEGFAAIARIAADVHHGRFR